jgi:hypothetical protein
MDYKRKPSPFLPCILQAVALLAIAPAAPASAAPAAGSVERGDAAFLLARDAYRNGERVRFGRQLALLQGHALQPWAEYWSLRLRLDDGDAGGVPDYLNRHAGTYLAEKLRGDWLRMLGEVGDRDGFQRELPDLVQPDMPKFAATPGNLPTRTTRCAPCGSAARTCRAPASDWSTNWWRPAA